MRLISRINVVWIIAEFLFSWALFAQNTKPIESCPRIDSAFGIGNLKVTPDNKIDVRHTFGSDLINYKKDDAGGESAEITERGILPFHETKNIPGGRAKVHIEYDKEGKLSKIFIERNLKTGPDANFGKPDRFGLSLEYTWVGNQCFLKRSAIENRTLGSIVGVQYDQALCEKFRAAGINDADGDSNQEKIKKCVKDFNSDLTASSSKMPFSMYAVSYIEVVKVDNPDNDPFKYGDTNIVYKRLPLAPPGANPPNDDELTKASEGQTMACKTFQFDLWKELASKDKNQNHKAVSPGNPSTAVH